MKALSDIFVRELTRLDDTSRQRPLTIEELKSLDLLTKSLKTYAASPISPDEMDDDKTIDELLQIIRENTDDG